MFYDDFDLSVYAVHGAGEHGTSPPNAVIARCAWDSSKGMYVPDPCGDTMLVWISGYGWVYGGEL